MLDASYELPEVESHDPEPVAVAIETARALFRTGESSEALRWLRRAAERAEESGDDVRAVQLARSAADLSTSLQSVPPPPTSRRHDEAIALAAYDDFSDKTAVDVSLPVARDALQVGVQIGEMPASSLVPRSVTLPSPSSNDPGTMNVRIAPVTELKGQAKRSALRVAVIRDPSKPGAFLVHPLAEGHSAPPGCEEALLVALRPHSTLLD